MVKNPLSHTVVLSDPLSWLVVSHLSSRLRPQDVL